MNSLDNDFSESPKGLARTTPVTVIPAAKLRIVRICTGQFGDTAHFVSSAYEENWRPAQGAVHAGRYAAATTGLGCLALLTTSSHEARISATQSGLWRPREPYNGGEV